MNKKVMLTVVLMLSLAPFCLATKCPAPDRDTLAHQVWLGNANLADELASHSRTMSILIRGEQKDLKKEWCTQLRAGSFSIGGGEYANWEMFLLKDGVHYRIKETDETLDIVKDRWVLSRKEGVPVVGTLH